MTINQNVEQTEEITTNNQNGETVAADSAKPNRTASILDTIISIICSDVSKLAHPRDSKAVSQVLGQILRTLFSINGLGEYELGIKAQDGVFYRFDEYQIPETFQAFVLGGKVVVSDVGTAVDFLARKEYQGLTANYLTPAEMMTSFKWLGSKLRVPISFKALSRPQVSLLAEVASFAVRSKKVADRNQASIVFLTNKFDEEQTTSIEEWAHIKAINLFS
jgi:uncharacterized coiled-coil protein SlyX